MPFLDIETTTCFLCGRGIVYRGSRFCSERCRDGFDLGLSPFDPNQVRALNAVPLGAWRVVAGPPGVCIGERYWGAIIDLPRRVKRRRKLRSGPLSINSKIELNNPTLSVDSKDSSGDAPTMQNEPNPSTEQLTANDNVPPRKRAA